MTLFERWSAVLESLKSQGRYRSLAPPCGLDFTSNDYLGYGSRRTPTAEELPLSGMASRLLRGSHEIWEEVESLLAHWHGAETALMMTSGYTANEGSLATILEPDDWIASDQLVHASIIDGIRMSNCHRFIFRHNDLNHLEEGLRAEASHPQNGRQRFIITESLFSMEGDLANLSGIVQLAERYGAHVLVDEAHSTGCYGSTGSGCVDAAELRSRILASVHTGGKALGVQGAYICGSRLLKEYLVNRNRHLIYTTALAPMIGAWWQAMLPHVRSDSAGRRALHDHATLFRSELAHHGITALGNSYVVPIVIGDDAQAVTIAKHLHEAGYDIRAIRPPSVPPGTARLRISIHSDHHPETLRRLATTIADAMRGVKQPCLTTDIPRCGEVLLRY